MTKDIDDFAIATATGFASNTYVMSKLEARVEQQRSLGNKITIKEEFAEMCYEFAEAMMAESDERKGKKVMEWQPIETAPTDGTPILGCPENRKNLAVEVWWNAGKWKNDYTSGEWIITHWMPLPQPPKEKHQ